MGGGVGHRSVGQGSADPVGPAGGEEKWTQAAFRGAETILSRNGNTFAHLAGPSARRHVPVSSATAHRAAGVSCFPSAPRPEIFEKIQQMWLDLCFPLLFKLGREANSGRNGSN